MHFKLDWKTIGLTTLENAKARVNVLLKKYEEVFSENREAMKYFSAKLNVKKDFCPNHFETKVCSNAIREAIEAKLKQLEADGIIEKVPYSEWAAPIVLVPRAMGESEFVVTIRLLLTRVSKLTSIPFLNQKTCLRR